LGKLLHDRGLDESKGFDSSLVFCLCAALENSIKSTCDSYLAGL
jgi:hypothetical protein